MLGYMRRFGGCLLVVALGCASEPRVAPAAQAPVPAAPLEEPSAPTQHDAGFPAALLPRQAPARRPTAHRRVAIANLLRDIIARADAKLPRTYVPFQLIPTDVRAVFELIPTDAWASVEFVAGKKPTFVASDPARIALKNDLFEWSARSWTEVGRSPTFIRSLADAGR